MPFKIVPVGLSDYPTIPVWEIIEKYISDNWLDSFIPAKNQIRFSYTVDQQVVVGAANALKCYDGGNTDDKQILTTNDNMSLDKRDVIIELQTRVTTNIQNDVPLQIHQMANIIESIINGDRTALRPQGIHIMFLKNNNAAYQDEKTLTIWKLKLIVETTRFLEKIPM